MPISNNVPRNQYVASPAQTEFVYSFRIFNKNDLEVYKANTATSEAVLQTISTDYTVAGVGLDDGGTVTLTAGATSGNIITIIRNIVNARETDYQQSGNFAADTVDLDFDRLWAAAQEFEQSFLTSFRLSETATSTPDLAVPTPLPDQIIGWNGAGDGLENKVLADFGQVSLPIPISSGGSGAITASAARTNLGIGLEQNQIWSGDHSYNGKLSVGPGSELTIAAGVVTATGNYHTVDTEADAANDDLATISITGFASGSRLTLNPADDARTVVLKHNPSGSGTIGLRDQEDVPLGNASDYLTLQLDSGGTWREINRSRRTEFTPAWIYGAETDYTTPAGDTLILSDLPPTVTEIEIIIKGVKNVINALILGVRLGTAGGIVTTGYTTTVFEADSSPIADTSTGRLRITGNSSNVVGNTGVMRLAKAAGNSWVSTTSMAQDGNNRAWLAAGGIELGALITQVQFLNSTSTNFNAGTVIARWR